MCGLPVEFLEDCLWQVKHEWPYLVVLRKVCAHLSQERVDAYYAAFCHRLLEELDADG